MRNYIYNIKTNSYEKNISYSEQQIYVEKSIIFFILSIFFAMLIISKLFGTLTIDSEMTMDAGNYYTGETFYNNIENLGVEGRETYLIIHLFDYFYIAFSYTFFAMLIYMLVKDLKKYHTFKYLATSPFLAGIADILENIGIDITILSWPNKLMIIANTAGFFTTLKMWTLYFVFIIILIFGPYYLFNKITRKNYENKKPN